MNFDYIRDEQLSNYQRDLDKKENEQIEWVSNCCGAKLIDNPDELMLGRCSRCLEHCVYEPAE